MSAVYRLPAGVSSASIPRRLNRELLIRYSRIRTLIVYTVVNYLFGNKSRSRQCSILTAHSHLITC
jgi:hypothetical protein